MKHINKAQKALLVLAILMVACLGCNRSPSKFGTAEYSTAGCYVQVVDHDDAHASARVWRDDSFLTDATVRFAGTDMPYFESHVLDSAYQVILRPAAVFAADTSYFAVVDGTSFGDSILINVADTFSITDNFEPPNRLLPGGGQVSLEWTAAANAEGYMLAAVKADSAYTGTGYTHMVESGQTAGTIPPDAFIDPITSVLETGVYYIYVYAFTGSPDSAQASHWLPTPLPFVFPTNISRDRLSGRFGTMAVTAHDSVYVTAGI
jgi:hypothetical protein